MTREQLERLGRLLADTAQTASTIELRALADLVGGCAWWAMSGGLIAWPACVWSMVSSDAGGGVAMSEFDDSKRCRWNGRDGIACAAGRTSMTRHAGLDAPAITGNCGGRRIRM